MMSSRITKTDIDSGIFIIAISVESPKFSLSNGVTSYLN